MAFANPARDLVSRTWLPALLLLLFAAQSLWFTGTQSLTYDEPAHIIAGAEAWRDGKFEHWNDHPPLGRLWLSLPLVGSHPVFAWHQLPIGFRVTEMQPGPVAIAWRTRPMNILLGLLLGMAIWFAGRKLFSMEAANTALALFAFTPSLIAHSSLATTDIIGALFIFLSAFQLVRWRHDPTIRNMLLMGVCLGGLLLSKFYAPPLVVLALGLMLVSKTDGITPPQRWNWKQTGAALLVALAVWWAGYFFHVSRVDIGSGKVVASFPNRPVKEWATKSQVQLKLMVPAGEFLEGLREVAFTNKRGRTAWFLGEIYPKGRIALYYPVAIVLKWPTVLLAMFFASLGFGALRSCRASGDLLLLCLFGMVYLAFALRSGYDIGERHILPLYPFALLIAGGIWEVARRHRAGIAVLMLALCLNAADALRYAPGYLSYFNIFVKPENSWRLLTDSNLDWGQGLIALRHYEQEHPGEALRLAYFGSVDPALYGVRSLPLSPGEQVRGRIVIGATCLSGQTLEDPSSYHWLWSYAPQQVIDHAMWMFDAGNQPQ